MDTDIRDRRDDLLTRRQVEERCCLSASSIYRFMRAGLFPEPVRVGWRAVRWHASEIDAWFAARPRSTGDRPSAVDV
ncbi:MAG: AlpA family phage regulatory protein [bacterium]|nr:AlpA family phage regulatory protein [bacterium]